MALFDMPLDQLRAYAPPRDEPADFDAFWQQTLAEVRRAPLDPIFEPVDSGLATLETFDVTFNGYGGQPITGGLQLPHVKALADRGERGLDEERRLCYVGFTRARKILRVTWCAKRQDSYATGKTARFKPTIPSQFLVEAGLLTRDDYQRAMTEAGFVPTVQPKAKRRAAAKSR